MRKKEMIERIKSLEDKLYNMDSDVYKTLIQCRMVFGKEWYKYSNKSFIHSLDCKPPSLYDITQKINWLYDYLKITERTNPAIPEKTYLKKRSKK